MNKVAVAGVLALCLSGSGCAPPAEHDRAVGDQAATATAVEDAMKALAERWDEANRSGDPASVTALYVADGAAAMATETFLPPKASRHSGPIHWA